MPEPPAALPAQGPLPRRMHSALPRTEGGKQPGEEFLLHFGKFSQKMTFRTKVWSSWSFALWISVCAEISAVKTRMAWDEWSKMCHLTKSLKSESGQRSLTLADYVFMCSPVVKTENRASTTAGKIHHHLHLFINKCLMPTVYPDLGRIGSGK